MYNLNWNKKFDPSATIEELKHIEEALNVKIPSVLFDLWVSCSGSWPPMRDDEKACYVVGADPYTNHIDTLAIFHGFSKPDFQSPTIDWLADLHSHKVKTCVAFGENGGSNFFLNYDNDPTRANPEIWDTYDEGETLEESWIPVAPNIETFFERLKTKSEAVALGIKFHS